MFFRIKKIKGKEYAYAVENHWKKSGSRQAVKAYLGRVYRFRLVNNVDFHNFLRIENFDAYMNNSNRQKVINDLIMWELLKFNISNSDFLVDLASIKIQKNRRNIVILINEGFMCSFTIRKLLDFKPKGDELSDGYRLAKAFVDAGINVPQETFIGIFGKFFKK